MSDELPGEEIVHNNTPKHVPAKLKSHTKPSQVPTTDNDNECSNYRCANISSILIGLTTHSVQHHPHHACHPRLTCAQPLHHIPASPPPSGADAAAWHLPQFSPISPIISMSEMLRKDQSRNWPDCNFIHRPKRKQNTHCRQGNAELRHCASFDHYHAVRVFLPRCVRRVVHRPALGFDCIAELIGGGYFVFRRWGCLHCSFFGQRHLAMRVHRSRVGGSRRGTAGLENPP